MKPLTTRISRRQAIQTAGAIIALPALESLGFRRCAAATAGAPVPKRLVFLGFGWGVTEDEWYPKIGEPGRDYALPAMLEPLAPHKADFSIVQGLWNRFTGNGHYGSTFWLTGANEYGAPGQSFFNSVSVDQVAARALGTDTRFESLALDCGEAANGSGHGPGLSLSWDARGKPVGGPRNPVEAFHRLFAKDSTPLEEQKALLKQRRSILDNALENARDLGRTLGKTDQDKLDEYLQGIRDLETRLSRDEKWIGAERPQPPFGEPQKGLAGQDEIKLMYDIIVAALQTDSTRVLTYRQPVTTLLTSLGLKTEAHTMSHYHGRPGDVVESSRKRDLAQSELLAGLITKLKTTKEPDGTSLFDHTTVIYGSNIRTSHSLDNCPTLITGKGAGVKLGENIVVPKNTPLCNAWLTLLRGSGVAAESFGDSTGPLREIVA
ncbi:MAG: DUF1552 domain-containing protein [Planctomycetia bacterium]|nr:DUF1552 domain-containing protein [Planctomycetia bacterium]